MKKPNIVFVFADQWRAQAFGYAGDPNVKTPHFDALAAESVNFSQAVSSCPVCTPYRASLLTGQRPLTHGLFVNDVSIDPNGNAFGDVFKRAGYDTGYIGKWHINGHGREKYIPPERRLGFDYWKVLECTHDYNHSMYYAGDSDEPLYWEGYDAQAQTRDAQEYIRNHGSEKPFLLMMSWGPPHAPLNNAPEEYQAMYDPETLELRPNVPPEMQAQAREWLAGYYAHCTALDDCLRDLLATLDDCGLREETIFVFTSDHGDMLGSQGQQKKQRPWEESVRVPFLLRWPGMPAWKARETQAPILAEDVMPTLLGLCDIEIPGCVEGLDFSSHLAGGEDPSNGIGWLTCPHAFGQWTKERHDGKEYRGLRTARYTYVRDMDGPWLLYDNDADPYQLQSRVDDPALSSVREELEALLQARLKETEDDFRPGMEYVADWGWRPDHNQRFRPPQKRRMQG